LKKRKGRDFWRPANKLQLIPLHSHKGESCRSERLRAGKGEKTQKKVVAEKTDELRGGESGLRHDASALTWGGYRKEECP